MKPSFGGHINFFWKKLALIVAFLRRLMNACNDNDVSEGKALYLLNDCRTGEAEQWIAQVLQDSAGHIVGRLADSHPKAVNWLLSDCDDSYSLWNAVEKLNRATIERRETPEAFVRRVRDVRLSATSTLKTGAR